MYNTDYDGYSQPYLLKENHNTVLSEHASLKDARGELERLVRKDRMSNRFRKGWYVIHAYDESIHMHEPLEDERGFIVDSRF